MNAKGGKLSERTNERANMLEENNNTRTTHANEDHFASTKGLKMSKRSAQTTALPSPPTTKRS